MSRSNSISNGSMYLAEGTTGSSLALPPVSITFWGEVALSWNTLAGEVELLILVGLAGTNAFLLS